MTGKKKIITDLREALDSLDITSDLRLVLIRAIEYLQREPVSKGLEEELTKYIESKFTIDKEQLDRLGIKPKDYTFSLDKKDMLKFAHHFAEWGRNHFEDKSEIKNEDLEEEIDKCWEGWIDPNPEVKGVDGYLSKDEFSAYARHFAEWQKQQMKEALQTEYEKGRFDMREEMMKDAISCNVDWYDGFRLDYTQEQQDDVLIKVGADVGDKVKIIIVKEN